MLQEVEPDLESVGTEVLDDQIFTWISDAERNLPFLRGSGRDVFGQPTSELVTAEGWRKLQEFGIKKGYAALLSGVLLSCALRLKIRTNQVAGLSLLATTRATDNTTV